MTERDAVAGQTVVVTGAAQGLGAAIARHFHGLDARLILFDRDEAGLARTVAACPGATAVTVDLADAQDTDRAIAEGITGPVDTLIHNAAILRVEPVEDVTLETFRAALDVGIQTAGEASPSSRHGPASRDSPTRPPTVPPSMPWRDFPSAWLSRGSRTGSSP